MPLLGAHAQLTLYLMRRLYAWISGLGLTVRDAVVNKSRSEGRGHHDLVLKHAGALASGPFYCSGFISLEVKVTCAGPTGRRFKAAWGAQKDIRRRFPDSQRGSPPVWLTWAAARNVYDYEVLGR